MRRDVGRFLPLEECSDTRRQLVEDTGLPWEEAGKIVHSYFFPGVAAVSSSRPVPAPPFIAEALATQNWLLYPGIEGVTRFLTQLVATLCLPCSLFVPHPLAIENLKAPPIQANKKHTRSNALRWTRQGDSRNQ